MKWYNYGMKIIIDANKVHDVEYRGTIVSISGTELIKLDRMSAKNGYFITAVKLNNRFVEMNDKIKLELK